MCLRGGTGNSYLFFSWKIIIMSSLFAQLLHSSLYADSTTRLPIPHWKIFWRDHGPQTATLTCWPRFIDSFIGRHTSRPCSITLNPLRSKNRHEAPPIGRCTPFLGRSPSRRCLRPVRIERQDLINHTHNLRSPWRWWWRRQQEQCPSKHDWFHLGSPRRRR